MESLVLLGNEALLARLANQDLRENLDFRERMVLQEDRVRKDPKEGEVLLELL